jgi:hypothetical protein
MMKLDILNEDAIAAMPFPSHWLKHHQSRAPSLHFPLLCIETILVSNRFTLRTQFMLRTDVNDKSICRAEYQDLLLHHIEKSGKNGIKFHFSVQALGASPAVLDTRLCESKLY